MKIGRGADRVRPDFLLWAGLLALLAFRLGALHFSVVDLYFDESQYWDWSRELAFGYYSKPPLLAWIIALADHACGSSEACVRAPSPFIHFATSLLICEIGRLVYGRAAGFWAAILYTLMPGVVFSSRVISTDVPLLFFWALMLLAYLRLLRGGSAIWTWVLGFAFGLGLLSKYSMLYFPLCVACAAAADRETRRWLKTASPWIALATGLVMIAPNLIWNANHGMVTILHVGHNIEGGGLKLSAGKFLEFVAGQFALAGPVLFGALLILAACFAQGRLHDEDRRMLSFVIPVLVLVSITALLTRANPNWTAVIYVAGAAAVAAWLAKANAKAWLVASVCIGLTAQGALALSDSVAYRIRIPGMQQGDIYRDTLGWRALGEETARIAKEKGAMSVAAESRREIASLIYSLRAEPLEVFAWPGGPVPADHFQMTRPLTPKAPQPVLLASLCPSAGRLKGQFESIENAGHALIPTGPASHREYFFFLLREPLGPLAPLHDCRGGPR